MTVLNEKDYAVSNWSGGTTIQLAIGPEGAKYADREFLWRVSSATVELEESDYTALPDYMRWIMPLNGEMVLAHNGGPDHEILPFQPYLFDGADATHCRGVCTDFNLMLRRDACRGEMLSAILKEGENRTLSSRAECRSLLVFCAQGSVYFPAQDVRLEKGMSLFFRGDAPRALICEGLSDTALAVACME